MKKSLFLLFASFSFIAANAQQITSKKGFPVLPEKGDWAISLNADGIFGWVGDLANGTIGNGAPTVNSLTPLTFVGKKFTSDKNALRVIASLGVGNVSNTAENVTSDEEGTTASIVFADKNTWKSSTTNFALTAGVGKEWRRGKTRLQGYYGADVFLTFQTSTTKITNTNQNSTGFKESKFATTGLGSAFGIGANGFLGAEYFIFPKMAIGAQYQYGLNIAVAGAAKESVTGWDNKTETTNGPKGTAVNLGNFGVASILLTLHF